MLLLSHYLEALKFQTNISKAIAIFGAKTPHPQTIVVGGITSVADMLNPQRLNEYIFILKDAKSFIDRAYLPDMKLLANVYRDEIKAGQGRAQGNFLSVGGYKFDEENWLFEDGTILRVLKHLMRAKLPKRCIEHGMMVKRWSAARLQGY